MDYWYLWLILAVLVLATVLVMRKASASGRARSERMKAEQAELERLRALRAEFKELTEEKAQNAEPMRLLEGVMICAQADIERAENMEAAFAALPAERQLMYALFYFVTDSKEKLSGFFRGNGEPLLSLSLKALSAVGAEDLRPTVQAEFDMLDGDNETVSYDADELERLDREFKEKADFAEILDKAKAYICKNYTHFNQ